MMIPSHTSQANIGRVRFNPAGAVTGIGSLPLTSVASAIPLVAEFSAEIPFWPQLPQLSEWENIIGQGLGLAADLIEPRNDGYGYQVKDGRIDSVVEILHRSSGELTPVTAAGFSAFEEHCRPVSSPRQLLLRGRSRAPSRYRLTCSIGDGLSWLILHFSPLSPFMSRRYSAGRSIT